MNQPNWEGRAFQPPTNHPGTGAYPPNDGTVYPNPQPQEFTIPQGYVYTGGLGTRQLQPGELEYGPYIIAPVSGMAPPTANHPSAEQPEMKGLKPLSNPKLESIKQFLRPSTMQVAGPRRYPAMAWWTILLTMVLVGMGFMFAWTAVIWSGLSVYLLNPIGGRPKRMKIQIILLAALSFMFFWFLRAIFQ